MTFGSNWMPSSKNRKKRFKNYYERLDKFFQQGQIQDAEQHCKFMARLRPKIRKLCVVRTYTDIEEMVVVVVEIEHILGGLGATPYEPMKEEHDETTFRESTIDCQFNVLNETLIISLGRGLMARLDPVQLVLSTLTTTINYASQKNIQPHHALNL